MVATTWLPRCEVRMGAEPGSSELDARLCKVETGSEEVERAVVRIFGSEHCHASPRGVHLPLRGTRHCDHHMSLQMHWASPAHISVELGSHWPQSGIPWLEVTEAGVVARITESTVDTGRTCPLRDARPLRTIASVSRAQYNRKIEYQNAQRCHDSSAWRSVRIPSIDVRGVSRVTGFSHAEKSLRKKLELFDCEVLNERVVREAQDLCISIIGRRMTEFELS